MALQIFIEPKHNLKYLVAIFFFLLWLYVAVSNKPHPSTFAVGDVVCVCVLEQYSYMCRIFFHPYPTFLIK